MSVIKTIIFTFKKSLILPCLVLIFTLSLPNYCLANNNYFNMLNSWNEGNVKQTIINFVNDVTNPQSSNFVPPENRIAVFDNDGTLWIEKPTYVQVFFMMSRLQELSSQHPEWQDKEPFKAVLSQNWQYLQTINVKQLIELIMATHAGMNQTEFEQQAQQFFDTATHPQLKRLYTELVFQPMLELLEYLRINDFKIYICSAGGRDFMRQFAPEVYGIQSENIIGSTINKKMTLKDSKITLTRLSEIVNPINDREGKPVYIEREIGKKPILAVGNSDGDIQMMEYTTINNNLPSLAILVHHDDSDREYSYTEGTEKALQLAEKYDWQIVSMKKDFKQIYPWENK